MIRHAKTEISAVRKLGFKVFEVSNLNSSLGMLKVNRVDFATCIPISCYAVAKELKLPPESVRLHKTRLFTAIGGFLIPKHLSNSDQLYQTLSTGLSIVSKNGKFLEILQKYYSPYEIPSYYLELIAKYRSENLKTP